MNFIDQQMKELEPSLRDVVVVYIINEETGEVLLGERKKVDKPGLGKRVGIGGGIEDSETPIQATLREVIEEVGTKEDGQIVFEIQNAEEVGIVYFLFPHIPEDSQRCFVFICKEWEGVPVETNAIKPEWHKIESLPEEFMWHDNLYWVPKVLAGEKVKGIFVYDENKKVKDYRFEQ
jgi:8-oxo-dGTP diphosphatase